MSAKVTTAGVHRLSLKMSRAANFLGGDGLRQLMNSQARDLVKQYEANIQTFTPGPVQDIKPATKQRKQREGWSVYPILKASGDMIRSMTPTVRKTKRAGWTISIAFRGTDRSGTPNADKAKGHLKGTAHLPIRDFTVLPKAWAAKVTRDIRLAMGWK